CFCEGQRPGRTDVDDHPAFERCAISELHFRVDVWMVAAEGDRNRGTRAVVLEVARVVETELLLRIVDGDDEPFDEVVAEDAVHAMSFTRRQIEEAERRRNGLGERRAGESHARAFELSPGDRAGAGPATDETRTKFD